MQKQDESSTQSNLQAVSGIQTLAPEKCFERGNDKLVKTWSKSQIYEKHNN